MDSLIVVFILSLEGLVFGFALWASVRGFRAFSKARGTRLVTCPENHLAAALDLDAKRAGLKALHGSSYLGLKNCSRWPERRDCTQDCLAQVKSLGRACLVENVVAGWYRGKPCACCHQPVDSAADWTSPTIALQAQNSKTVRWDEVPPEDLPALFSTRQPVCQSCYLGEMFRREHPGLVAKWSS